jgi:hypothetical protein
MGMHGRLSSGITTGLLAVAVTVAVLQSQSSAAEDPACAASRAEALRLVHEGDIAAGAVLALQETDPAAYKRESKAAAATKLRGFRLIAAHRGCFSTDERASLDGQITRLEHITGSAGAVPRQANRVLVAEGDKLLVSYQGREITQDELGALMNRGKALFQAVDMPSASRGLMHAFDTQHGIDAYTDRYLAQARATATAPESRRGVDPL